MDKHGRSKKFSKEDLFGEPNIGCVFICFVIGNAFICVLLLAMFSCCFVGDVFIFIILHFKHSLLLNLLCAFKYRQGKRLAVAVVMMLCAILVVTKLLQLVALIALMTTVVVMIALAKIGRTIARRAMVVASRNPKHLFI